MKEVEEAGTVPESGISTAVENMSRKKIRGVLSRVPWSSVAIALREEAPDRRTRDMPLPPSVHSRERAAPAGSKQKPSDTGSEMST